MSVSSGLRTTMTLAAAVQCVIMAATCTAHEHSTIQKLLAAKAGALAKLNADIPLLAARAVALSQNPGAAMDAQCADDSGLPFVWFHSPGHVALALSDNTSHPRIFWGHVVSEVLPIGYAYFDLAGSLLGAMLPPPLKVELCTHVWGAKKGEYSRGAARGGREVLEPMLEDATTILNSLFHVHLNTSSDLTALLLGAKHEHVPAPAIDFPAASKVQKCNRTARFRHHRAPTIAAIYPSFPAHWTFVSSGVQLTHQYQTLPPGFTVIATGLMNLTAAPSFYAKIVAANKGIAGLIVVASNAKQDTSECRNAGANVVHTQLISFIDSDDRPHPQRFEMLRWVHDRTHATFMLHRWQPTGRCSGKYFPGVTFKAVAQTTDKKKAHPYCYTAADFLGVNMKNFLPGYQPKNPAGTLTRQGNYGYVHMYIHLLRTRTRA